MISTIQPGAHHVPVDMRYPHHILAIQLRVPLQIVYTANQAQYAANVPTSTTGVQLRELVCLDHQSYANMVHRGHIQTNAIINVQHIHMWDPPMELPSGVCLIQIST